MSDYLTPDVKRMITNEYITLEAGIQPVKHGNRFCFLQLLLHGGKRHGYRLLDGVFPIWGTRFRKQVKVPKAFHVKDLKVLHLQWNNLAIHDENMDNLQFIGFMCNPVTKEADGHIVEMDKLSGQLQSLDECLPENEEAIQTACRSVIRLRHGVSEVAFSRWLTWCAMEAIAKCRTTRSPERAKKLTPDYAAALAKRLVRRVVKQMEITFSAFCNAEDRLMDDTTIHNPQAAADRTEQEYKHEKRRKRKLADDRRLV